MRPLMTMAAGLAAAILTTAAATAAETAIHDPMNALTLGAPLDALRPAAASSASAEATPAPAPTVAVADPMAAAGRPPGTQPGTQPGTTAGEETALAAFAPDPELGDLPNAPGAEEVYYTCVACHSTAIIRQQRVTDARWDYLWGWMIEAQGMVEPDEETKAIVLGYLKQHFSSER